MPITPILKPIYKYKKQQKINAAFSSVYFLKYLVLIRNQQLLLCL